MSRFDKYSQMAVGILFVVLIFFCGIKTVLNIRDKDYDDWSRAATDTRFDGDFYSHDDFIDMNGAFRAAIGTRIMRDADPQNMVFKTASGDLTTMMAAYDVTEAAGNTAAFYEWLQERGIDFLYVMAPNKNSAPECVLPPGVKDSSDVNMNSFVKKLPAEVPLMDLREEFAAAGLDWSQLFYVTDHHWLPSTALWVNRHILEYFNERGTLEASSALFDEVNFASERYEKLFLGSLGRRVGRYFGGTDDFEFIYPVFETEFSLNINQGMRETLGDFREALIYAPLLQMDEEHLWDNHYGAYFGGDYAEVVIKNSLVEQGKVLLIKDSYSLPLAAFMSCSLAELRMLDLRYFKDSVEDYIEEYQPDAVILLYSPSEFSAKYMFRFLNGSK